MREINVGDYVRTKYGIKKIHEINKKATKWKYLYKCKKQDGDGCIDLCYLNEDNILKSSKKIKDLIGVGDFVNGMRIVAKDSDNRLYVAEDLGQPYDREFYNGCFEYTILDERFKIESILTKEQFESMAYEVEEC